MIPENANRIAEGEGEPIKLVPKCQAFTDSIYALIENGSLQLISDNDIVKKYKNVMVKKIANEYYYLNEIHQNMLEVVKESTISGPYGKINHLDIGDIVIWIGDGYMVYYSPNLPKDFSYLKDIDVDPSVFFLSDEEWEKRNANTMNPHDPNISPSQVGYTWQPEQNRTDLGRDDNKKIKDDKLVGQEKTIGGGNINIDQKAEPTVCEYCGSTKLIFDRTKIQVQCGDCGQWYRMLENSHDNDGEKKYKFAATKKYDIYELNKE